MEKADTNLFNTNEQNTILGFNGTKNK
jgi:hypothetical protein